MAENNVQVVSAEDVFDKLQKSMEVQFSTGDLVKKQQSLIFLLSGPSGVGKDSVDNEIRKLRPDIHFVVTAASRAKRPGEVDGVDYIFVSRDEFERMIREDELVEYANVYGEYKGVPRKQLEEPLAAGKDVMLQVDVQGAATLRRLYNDRVVSLFLMAESEATLVQRLVGRQTEALEQLQTRVMQARKEYLQLPQYNYVVVNRTGHLKETVEQVLKIMEVEKLKPSRIEFNLG